MLVPPSSSSFSSSFSLARPASQGRCHGKFNFLQLFDSSTLLSCLQLLLPQDLTIRPSEAKTSMATEGLLNGTGLQVKNQPKPTKPTAVSELAVNTSIACISQRKDVHSCRDLSTEKPACYPTPTCFSALIFNRFSCLDAGVC